MLRVDLLGQPQIATFAEKIMSPPPSPPQPDTVVLHLLCYEMLIMKFIELIWVSNLLSKSKLLCLAEPFLLNFGGILKHQNT